MSDEGIRAAREIRDNLPKASLTLAAELRNAITPTALLTPAELENMTLTEVSESIRDTVHHVMSLVHILQGNSRTGV